jgi:hypothetical protein
VRSTVLRLPSVNVSRTVYPSSASTCFTRTMIFMLLQWSDPTKGSPRPGVIPGLPKLVSMERRPLSDEHSSPPGEPTLEDPQSVERHGGFLVRVPRVEVRRTMVVVIQRDHDPEEPADLGQAVSLV